MTATEIIEIKHRWTGEVLFAAEVKAGLSTPELKLGAAVKIAIQAGASLVGARLDGASLVGASLVGARLDRARLDRAILVGASLVGARLDGASLVGARLDEALGVLDCGTPHGWRVLMVRHEDGIRIAAGCRWFTFAKAVEHWRDRSDRELMQPLLSYIRAACEINGWPLGAGKVEG